MTLTPRSKARLLQMAAMVAAGEAYTLAYNYVLTVAAPAPMFWACWIQAMVFGGAIGVALAAFHGFYVDSPSGAWIRRAPFLLSLALRVAASLALIVIVNMALRAVLPPAGHPVHYQPDGMLLDVGVAFAGMVLLFVFFQMRQLIGGRVLANFVLGRYFRPVREERIFLFLDLAGSTTLAERLGEETAHAFVSRFFFVIDRAFLECCGEVHRYLGDGAVVTWPLAGGAAARPDALRAVFRARALIAAEAESWQQDFGQVPAFRAGLHGGPVVAGECGDSKQEIVYIGDSINMAARIEGQCRDLGCDLLISRDLLDRLDLPPDWTARPVATVRLRGRQADTDLWTVAPGPLTAGPAKPAGAG